MEEKEGDGKFIIEREGLEPKLKDGHGEEEAWGFSHQCMGSAANEE